MAAQAASGRRAIPSCGRRGRRRRCARPACWPRGVSGGRSSPRRGRRSRWRPRRADRWRRSGARELPLHFRQDQPDFLPLVRQGHDDGLPMIDPQPRIHFHGPLLVGRCSTDRIPPGGLGGKEGAQRSVGEADASWRPWREEFLDRWGPGTVGGGDLHIQCPTRNVQYSKRRRGGRGTGVQLWVDGEGGGH